MLVLEHRARDVISSWETGDLAAAVRALDAELREITALRETCAQYIHLARERFADEDCEIDDQPYVSPAEEETGCFVNAWIWINKPD